MSVSVSLAVAAGPARTGHGLTTIARDITERVRSEAVRARHAALVEHSADAIVAIDIEGRVIAWNHAATALYGFSEREALGAVAADLVPTPTATTPRAGAPARRRGRPPRDDPPPPRRGELIIASTLSPIRDLSGPMTGVVGVSRDVTLERRSQAALQAAQARFQAAFEHAPIGIALVRADDGVIIEANGALCEMTGYADGESWDARSMSCITRTSAGLRQNLQRVQTGAIAHVAGERRFLHRQGHVVYTQVRAALIESSTDGHYGIIQVLDVSERKQFRRTAAPARRSRSADRPLQPAPLP